MGKRAFIVAGTRCAGRVPPALERLVTEITRQGAEVILILGCRDPGRTLPTDIPGVRIGYAHPGQPRHAFYRAGLELLGEAGTFTQIVLCDDSFVALNPAQLISDTLAAASRLDLASLTMVGAPEPCLQSYWLSLAGRVELGVAAFHDWWHRAPDRTDLSLTRHFQSAGYRANSLFHFSRSEEIIAVCRAHACGALPATLTSHDTFELDHAAARALDPTIFAWDRLMADFGVVSLQLLEQNPCGVNIVKLRRWIVETPGAAALFGDILSPARETH